jgi:hypothetical protein
MQDLSFEEICAMLVAPTGRRFLFAHWEGGGNTPPMLAIVRRLACIIHEGLSGSRCIVKTGS